MVKKIATIKNLTKCVMASILIVIIYSIAEFITSVITGVSHETLTTCIFTLFGTELGICGFIKIFKIKGE